MKRILILLVALTLLTPGAVLAQTDTGTQSSSPTDTGTSPTVPTYDTGTQPPQGIGITNPLKGGTLMNFLVNILNFLTHVIGPIIIILMLVYIGFLFATSSVKPANIQKAREALLYTVLG